MNTELTPDEAWLHVMLERNGYRDGKLFGDGRYAAVVPKIYTTAIIVGKVGWDGEYDDTWCYTSPLAAVAAMRVWDGAGEPTGWIRHPPTGRRVSVDGNEIDEHGQRVGAVGVMYRRP